MKTNIPFILFCLLSLASCGQGGKTSTSLKISSSFALSNGLFDGGLVIYGTNGDKSFARTLSYSAGSQSTLDISLPNGNWSFYATGWKNSGGVSMTGDIHCAATLRPVELKGVDVKVPLTPTQAGCASEEFTNTSFRDSIGPNRVKKLALVSCNAFYEDVSSVFQPITPSSNIDFCGTSSMPLDLRNQARSFKLSVQSKALAGEALPAGFTTTCQQFSNGGSNGVNSSEYSNFRIPSNHVPVNITLFQDADCSEEISSQPMLDGLSYSYGDDKVLLDGTTTHGGLVLASNQLRKGFSHFFHQMPTLKCQGQLCLASKLETTSFDYYTSVDPLTSPNLQLRLDRDKSTTAGDYSVTVGGNGWTLPTACTKDSEDYLVCTFVLSTSCGGACHSDSGKTFEFDYSKHGSPTVTKAVYIFENRKGLSSLSTMLRASGQRPATPKILDGSNGDDNGDHSSTGDYGLLSQPRFLLSPAIGGLISFPGQTCSTAQGSKQFVFNEDGTSSTYEISIGATSPIGFNFFQSLLFCDPASPNTASCGSLLPYQKRITVRKFVGPGNWVKFISMEFSCDDTNKAGRFQEHNDDFYASRRIKRRSRNIIAWMASSPKERVELYSREQEFEDTVLGDEKFHDATFMRLYKGSAWEAELNGISFHRKKFSINNYEETGMRFQNFVTSVPSDEMNFFFDSIVLSNATAATNLFNHVSGATLRNLSSVNANTSFSLVTPSTSPASSSFLNYGTYFTSIGSHEIKVNSLNPTTWDTVFSDGFF